MSAVAQPLDAPTTRSMADALRMLAIDAVEVAKSGHPGMPLGMAEIAVALWDRHLKHNPRNPAWRDRDRFIVSNGHGSMLLYGLLHLSGYDLPIDELKRFRQLHSKTPGHPEVGATRCCHRACRASRSRRACAHSGGNTSGSTAAWSVSIRSANRPRPLRCSSISD
ncbi:Transketolase domain protein [Burkholderia sp. H160]|nr:Transketolase domain protein [Burkholderia sp. H160]